MNEKRISFSKGHKCDLCPQEFYMIDYLESHKKRYHEETEGKHPCQVCGLYFVKAYLIQHQLTHTKTKNYQCDTCQKAFSQKHTLITHKRIHTGDKPYVCDKCDKAFSRLSNLTLHYRTHTGEKPYKCDHCENDFATSSNLRRHQRKYHQN